MAEKSLMLFFIFVFFIGYLFAQKSPDDCKCEWNGSHINLTDFNGNHGITINSNNNNPPINCVNISCSITFYTINSQIVAAQFNSDEFKANPDTFETNIYSGHIKRDENLKENCRPGGFCFSISSWQPAMIFEFKSENVTSDINFSVNFTTEPTPCAAPIIKQISSPTDGLPMTVSPPYGRDIYSKPHNFEDTVCTFKISAPDSLISWKYETSFDLLSNQCQLGADDEIIVYDGLEMDEKKILTNFTGPNCEYGKAANGTGQDLLVIYKTGANPDPNKPVFDGFLINVISSKTGYMSGSPRTINPSRILVSSLIITLLLGLFV